MYLKPGYVPEGLSPVSADPMLTLMARECETVADELELQAICDQCESFWLAGKSLTTSLNTKD